MKEFIIITTVGTSIIENYKKSIDKFSKELSQLKIREKDLKKSVNALKNIPKLEEFKKIKLFFKGFKKDNKIDEFERVNDNLLNTDASAEIKSLLYIYKKYQQKYEKFKVYLLASDTVAGFISAKLVKEWFEEAKGKEIELADSEPFKLENLEIVNDFEKPDPKKNYIENLRTEGVEEKQIFNAFENLVERIRKIKDKHKNDEILINITGGYKGFIPILAIVAQLEKFNLAYIYEQSEKLIEIGSFAISYDYTIVEEFHYYLNNPKAIEYLNEKGKELLEKNNLINIKTLKLTKFGEFLKDYLNKHKSGLESDVLGHYYEHKLFYEIFQDRVKYLHEYQVEYLNYKNLPEEISGEIDLILKRKDNFKAKAFIEVKSFNKSTESKTEDQIKKYINFAKKYNCGIDISELKCKLDKIILFVYKFDFQYFRLNKIKRLKDFKKFCESQGVKFSVLYIDIPVTDENVINYKQIFDQELEIKELKEISK